MYLFLFLKIYLFLAVLSLHCCKRTFSSSGEQGPIFVGVVGLLSAVAPLWWGTRQACGLQELWLRGLGALRHVGSSQTRGQTHAPCIGR